MQDIGVDNVVQIVTDNGANYRAVCLRLSKKYPTLVWQPYLAHTINLMLKDIGEFLKNKAIIESAKKICRWPYNSRKLHALMKQTISGELAKWNATRFGTNFTFLESFWKHKNAFMQWMASTEFEDTSYCKSEEGQYAHKCLSDLRWWARVRECLNAVEYMYGFLCLADTDSYPTIGMVLPYHRDICEGMYRDLKEPKRTHYLKVMDERLKDVELETYINAAVALSPDVHYSRGSSDNILSDLRWAFDKMTDSHSAVQALVEVDVWRRKVGSFGGMTAREMALNDKTNPDNVGACLARICQCSRSLLRGL